MIIDKNKLLTKKNRFAVLITECTANNLESIVQTYKNTFDSYGEIDFCFVISDKKKKKEEIIVPSGVHLFHLGEDINFFGKIKNQELEDNFINADHSIMLCSYFENNKSVNKLIFSKNVRLTVGIEKESLPKFDVSFLMESENHNRFIDLSLKYLKML
jgi:hypothetical protein